MSEKLQLHIIGCGSARPTKQSNQTSQILTQRGKQYMIDCGEGTQFQLRRQNMHINRMNHIFISHLHGDHFFGLIGLISTLGMLGRTAELCIHAMPEIEKLLNEMIKFCCQGMTYEIRFCPINPYKHELIYEDRTMEVYTIPLKHRVPCCGFLFKEKENQPHLIKDMIDFYKIPIAELAKIKNGADYITPDGEIVANNRLTTPADPIKSYAYCSDTAYSEKIIPIIEGVDCLYHEATFMKADEPRARLTCHSTTEHAATIAKLAQVKQLIIGHYSARYDEYESLLNEAKAIFPNTLLAIDGKDFEI